MQVLAPLAEDEASDVARISGGHKPAKSFRDYVNTEKTAVADLYRENHSRQTLDFVLQKKAEFLPLRRRKMGLWEAVDFLNSFTDESDPDTSADQRVHMLQTAEAARHDGLPRWFVLTAFLHDIGKVLACFGEPQWAVVGDTFPVGCAFSDKIVHHEFFKFNPDSGNSLYQTPCGIYEPACGLSNVHLSWGHDEYAYQVLRGSKLPEAALYIIRYHSFYAQHRDNGYAHLLSEKDHEMLDYVRTFNSYDLYSKAAETPCFETLLPYYDTLIREFLPDVLDW